MAIPSERRAGIGLEIKSMAPGFRTIDGLFLSPQPFLFRLLSQTQLHQNQGQKSPDFVDYHAPCQITLRSRISGAQDGSELEDKLKVLNKKTMEPESEEPKPEPTTEILFLCSYEGCSKAFSTEIAYRKHSYTHGHKQHACTFPGCKKKFRDSSKLKRHQVVHTGERNFFCPYKGCGKAFSLDFNMRSHVRAIHEKTSAVDMTKQMSREAKICKNMKTTAANLSHASSDRPHVCPFEGCGKAYIYKYKLDHHLKNQHPDLNPEDSNRRGHVIGNTTDEASGQDVYIAKGGVAKNSRRSKPNLRHQMPPAKLSYLKGSSLARANATAVTQQNPSQEGYEEDSEETEDEIENITESCGYREACEDDNDEETDEE